MMNKKERLNEFFQDVWVRRNLKNIKHYISDQTTVRNLIPGLSIQKADHHEMIFTLLEMFDNLEVNMHLVIEEGDWVSALYEFKGTSAISGEPVNVFGQMFTRFEGDKFGEVYVNFDFLAMFEQFGQLPKDAHGLLLSGTVLR